MSRKRILHQSNHPFDSYPFEAYISGSWQAVEFITIESGTLYMHLKSNPPVAMEKGPFSDIRVKSRKAVYSDCSSFLRRGIDISVLSPPKKTDNSDGLNLKPVWLDARISSIQRKPHNFECQCQFYVNFYVNQGSLGAELRTLRKEVKVFGINQISILQKLDHSPCENEFYRWASSEDCPTLPNTKLLLGKFLADISWLVVASFVKKVQFCVRSFEDKLVYQIMESEVASSSLNTESPINVLSFTFDDEDGLLVSNVSQVVTPKPKTIDYAHESHEDKVSPSSYNVEGLRRSKRRHVQPERYIGCSDVTEFDVGSFRTQPPMKIDTAAKEDDELELPLSCLFGLKQKPVLDSLCNSQKISKMNTCGELLVYNRRRRKPKTKKLKSIRSDQNPLAIVPLPDQVDPVSVKHCDLNDKVTGSHGRESSETPLKNYHHHHLASSSKQKWKNVNLLTFDPNSMRTQADDAEKIDGFSSRSHFGYGTSKIKSKNSFFMDDMDLGGTKWEGICSSKGAQEKTYRPIYSRSRNHEEERRYKDRSLNATAYKDLINSYLRNINTKPTTEEPPVTDQWKQFQETSGFSEKKETGTEISEGEDENDEESEIEMLWREMEVSLASSYLEDAEGSNAGNPAETLEKLEQGCLHDEKYQRMDDQIGIYCRICGHVFIDIKDMFPPFLERSERHHEEKQCIGEDSDLELEADEHDDYHLFSTNAPPDDEPKTEESENVWALIPELRSKLHAHQKKAFEFLWQNIAGSTEPALLEAHSKKTGGCVISHTPGAGKTFLIIAFLVSYLKLFPGKRPLVLAPKTTLYTWYKEFIKWKIPIPVYLIHGRRTYRVFKQKNSMIFPGIPKPTEDVKHVLDCLEKIKNWHSQPSVLIMGYTSFLTLMREDSKYAHRKYMAKVLRESPGMLILDEGHNPRSTKSRLRKVLMKVHTELRILLSGTLFQNNFCEYFNTLCLARPKFAHEVLKALDPKYKRKKKKGANYESRARKLFLDTIAKKIDSHDNEERMHGLNMLRNVTHGFIDVYEGGSSDGLPGLQIYTLLMNPTETQHEMLHTLHEKMSQCNGYPLEIELLITLGSIHPWLIKTAVCAEKFFSKEQLSNLEKCKFDLKIGSKVKFVLSLIYRVVKNEKVLIFCHNIAPVKLFLEYFERYFRWQRGREVLVLTGELELFERGRVMDKFEEPGGVSKILLASITACAEGISLTAASRVIMLDSEWNPSKTKQAIARAFRPGQQKMVYVYQLLVSGSLEEDKYKRTTWKEWVSNMIFSEDFVEDPSQWQANKLEDDILREMVEEDKSKSFHMILKNEKASTNREDHPKLKIAAGQQ
ncbi:putative calcium/calmodulin-dependent protein kinase chromatin remodeling SNF2 family [Lupinus albus]|uniref:Putative calcium/calmodulin-dependent protein kinase chromatin remodeling SNF2 family n=1 Tax=Lupinus albus TaxID=3870 RepID=A0A6A4P422_LUPAL|nr:putative calcium/calmodulin-dependent protein kinase chromatin remodeling SNF2 family [Lupinus albus]